jgi:hypothetical protein
MASINGIFRIWMSFPDRLELVQAVTATTIASGNPESAAAILKGPDNLEEFLVAVGIDSYLVASGDLCFHSTLSCTLYITEPKSIVQHLKRRFDEDDAVQLKIISGERISDSEMSAKLPVSITVCAQAVTPSEGLRRVRQWNEKG